MRYTKFELILEKNQEKKKGYILMTSYLQCGNKVPCLNGME